MTCFHMITGQSTVATNTYSLGVLKGKHTRLNRIRALGVVNDDGTAVGERLHLMHRTPEI
jgi:hypothetical protein